MSSSTARRRPPGSSSPPSASPSITFTTTPSILRDIMSNRDTGQQAASFYDALHSHPERGIQNNAEQLANRQAVFGVNVIAPKKPKSIFKLALNAALDVSLIILQLAALISFVLAFVAPPEEAGPEGKPAVSESHANWIEGVAIMVSVFLVIIITAWNDWKKETQFQALKDRIDKEVKCSVVRDGISMEILVSELVVGDVCQIKYGDLIPADGLLIASNDLLLDESSLTGESDHVKKDPVNSPLIYSGTHVMEGSGRMLIVAVGVNSQAGIIMKLLGAAGLSKAEKAAEKVAKKKKVEAGKVKIKSKGAGDIEMQSLGGDDDRMEEVPLDEEHRTGGMDEVEQAKGTEKSVLQTKLTKLSGQIGYIGMSIAILTVLVLWSRFSYDTYITAGQSFLTAHLNYFVKYFIIGITVLVVAIPEGLPLAVTISLACSVQRMTKDNNLVRHLDACETMGNATTICSDKTGTLTTNRMKVMEAWTLDTSFRGKQLATALKKNSGDETRILTRKLAEAIVYNCADTSKIVPAQITAQNGSSSSSSARQAEQLGNKTECALLGFVDDDLGFSYEELRRHAPQQVKVYTFNSARKSMSTVVSRAGGEFVVYTKGASEIILNKCRYYLDASGTPQLITDAKRDQLLAEVINPMADDALRSIAIAAKEYVKPSKSAGRPARNVEQMFGGAEPNWDDEEHVVDDLTLLAVIGIEDPVRDEVPEAIRNCQQAGITVRMVTGDNLNTARSIATRCGILRPDEDFLVLDSARFNELIRDPTTGRVSQKRFDTVWPRLRVLARSSPADKYILVKHIVASKLHPNREVVAVTGDGTNDAPALKKADVGFAMGIAGTDVAKEAADIIITDDNFSSIVKSVMWGRNVYDCIAKFLQFQLTVNVVAVVVAFAGAAMIEDSPLKAVQMLWVNLIMDSFASVAMAYEALSPDLLNRPPYGRKRALISPRMWLNIVGHSVYQLVLIFTILFWGPEFLGIESGINRGPLAGPSQHFSFIFNAFVLMTIFNEVNCRKLHGQRNVFAGITQNPMFCLIIILSLLVQVVIFLIPLCRNIFNIAPLSFSQWMWCLVLGASVLVWNQILITIPIEQLYPDWREDSAGTKTVPPPPSEETADKTKVAPEDATAPSDKISAPASSRRAQAAAAATIPGAIDEDEEEDEEEDSGTSSTTSTRVLWLRGFLRLQQQLRVVNAFQAELKRRPTPDAARMAYAHQRQLITSQESKEGKDVPVAFV